MKPRFLITAGPTREFFDPVRFISNRSSGRMGYELARAARRVAGKVVLVSGPTALKVPRGVKLVPVVTAREMAKAVWSRQERVDIIIMAAAVCDFRPKRSAKSKIKKGKFTGMLELEATPDILAELGRRKTQQVLVGFAAETDGLVSNAKEKLKRKNLDLIIANDAEAMEAKTNRVALLYPDGRFEWLPEMPKAKVATEIIRRVIALRT